MFGVARRTKGNCWVMLEAERELFKSDNSIWFWTYLVLFLGKIVRSGDYFIFLKQLQLVRAGRTLLISGAVNVLAFSQYERNHRARKTGSNMRSSGCPDPSVVSHLRCIVFTNRWPLLSAQLFFFYYLAAHEAEGQVRNTALPPAHRDTREPLN